MRLNTIQPGEGSRKKKVRVGRGPGSGIGKTCGRGVKGQKSRSGGFHKVGFEGGQMPLQRRLPKFGFTSRAALVTKDVRLSDLNKLSGDLVTIETLQNANLLTKVTKFTKIYLCGELTKKVTVQGIKVTAGAKKAIEALGGQVQEKA